jgi:hypothetical protein
MCIRFVLRELVFVQQQEHEIASLHSFMSSTRNMKTNWCFAQMNQLNEPDVRILKKQNEKDFDGTTKVGNTDDRGGDQESQKHRQRRRKRWLLSALNHGRPQEGHQKHPIRCRRETPNHPSLFLFT